MNDTQTTHTIRLERTMKAPAERIYKAFLDPWASAKFLPPHGFIADFPEMDAKVGGTFRGIFRSLDGKVEHSFGGTYLELEPYTKIRYNDQFETDNPDMQSEMEVTITLEERDGVTKVSIVQSGIPAVIPPENAQTGWGQTLDLLTQLVEFDVQAEA